MNRIFCENETEREFRHKGYVVRSLLKEEEIEALRRLYHSLPAETETHSDYYVTTFSRDSDYRKNIYKGFKTIFEEKFKEIISHYCLCLGQFVSKAARSKQGKVRLHQDWSFVDIKIHTGVNFWCPLIDVDKHNGCLKVVVGSHTFIKHIRTTPKNPAPYDPVTDVLDAEFSMKIPMKAGSILFYDGGLLHSSDDNQSEYLRIAAQGILVPETVSPRLYSWNNDTPSKLEVFDVNENFLFRYEPETFISKPHPMGVRYLGSIDYDVVPLRPEDLKDLRLLQTELMVD